MSTIISPEGLEEIRKAATARGWVQRGGADWFDPTDENGQPWPAPGIRICWHANGKEVSVLGEKTVVYPITAPVTDALAAIDRLHPLPAEPAKEATDEDVIAYLRAIGADEHMIPLWGHDDIGHMAASIAMDEWLVLHPVNGWEELDPPDALASLRKHHPLPAEPVPDPAPTSSPTTAAPIEGSVAAVEGPSGWLLGDWESPVIVATPDFAAKVLTVTLPDGWRLDEATIERIRQSFPVDDAMAARVHDWSQFGRLRAERDAAMTELRAIDEALGYHEGSTRSEGDRIKKIKGMHGAIKELCSEIYSIRSAAKAIADIDAALEGHIRPDGDRARSIRDLVAGRQRPESSAYTARLEGALMARDPDLLERVRRG